MPILHLCVALVFGAIAAAPANADRLDGDAAKHAREKLRDIKKQWTAATKAEKLPLLEQLGALPEKSIGEYLLELVGKEVDADTASEAARALTRHGEASDARNLVKAFNAAKEPARRAGCLRWLGAYKDDSPVNELQQAALSADPWAEAAVLAIADSKAAKSGAALEKITTDSKSMEARCTACACLIVRGEMSGVRGLSSLDTLERVSQAALAATGGALETEAVERVIDFAKRNQKFQPGVRPHNFGSLLARLQKPESHEKLVAAAADLHKSIEVEVSWWLIGWCTAGKIFKVARAGLEDEDKDRIISGLRCLQNAAKPLEGDDLKEAGELLAKHLSSAEDDVCCHALLACAASGACVEATDKIITDWIKDEARPLHRAAALLSVAKSSRRSYSAACVVALGDKCWYVASAELEALRVIRPTAGLMAILELAKKEQGGRIFAEAVALLCDLTGEDFGDDLVKWEEWIKGTGEAFKPAAPRLKTLRGVAVKRTKQATAAKFFSLEFESENIEFTLDRSISMTDVVRREPDRLDFGVRKADILKRRPEVKRMVRDGFLPRFHVACTELAACLELKEQRTRFGITLFNGEIETYAKQRTINGPTERKAAVNWMLSSDVKGGTDIEKALIAVIEKGEADTILLLSDGEPLSLGILEQIQRANVFKRVDIHVINLAKITSARSYLQAIAQGAAGRLVDAEPR